MFSSKKSNLAIIRVIKKQHQNYR